MPDNEEIEKKESIRPTPITEEMEKAYLDYAMSVIVARALPDIRDGLKPVQRRIIHAMNEQGMGPTARYHKCAAVVGETLKKYHPHGDMAVYDALVRMGQDFSLRYPLIDGQGNFGSVDGDSPAAMRYTECRLAPISEELLNDIESETVPFVQNYDATTTEPAYLPAAIPNLLLNGCSGIAVGMATNIPPHNLAELIDALVAMIDEAKVSGDVDNLNFDTDLSVEDLMQWIAGPDFPTAAQVYGQEEIVKAYATGKGGVVIRAKAEITEEKGKTKIIISELPYQVNKAQLITKMATLVKKGKVKGVSALRDESDREGIRVVVELKKDARPNAILNRFYKHTPLQTVFHANMVALVNGQPQVLTLKGILEEFLKHRFAVVVKRTRFLLKKAEGREHILQGLKIALDHLDEVIATIKKSRDADHARGRLVERFGLTEIQAQAILDMPLKRLSALEREKIEQELKDILEEIKRLKTLLATPKNIFSEIKSELGEVKETYGDERRTKIFKRRIGEFSEEDLIPEENVILTVTKSGYIKRVKLETYRRQGRGGKGVKGMATKEEDIVSEIRIVSTHDDLFFFTDKGRVYRQKVYDVPEAGRAAKGTPVVNLIDLSPEEKVSAILPVSKENGINYIFMATRKGMVKKTAIEDFANIRRTGIIAIRLKKEDGLSWVKGTSGNNEIMLITKQGQSIRFIEKQARPMGRAASGVKGISLKKGDELIGMEVVTDPEDQLFIVCENGFGKRTKLSKYRRQNRGGSGILTVKVTRRTGTVVDARIIKPGLHDVLLISAQGKVIRLPLKSVSVLGRATQGVTLMRLDKGDKVVSLAIFEKEEEQIEKEGKEKREEKKTAKAEKPKPKKTTKRARFKPKRAKLKKRKEKRKTKAKKTIPKRKKKSATKGKAKTQKKKTPSKFKGTPRKSKKR
jgi:DNA gyrase subunit A